MAYTLYYKPECPYCKKVLTYMKNTGVELPLADIHEPENEAKLIELGGKKQVPCLDIDGTALYESMDIIYYIKDNLVK